MELKMCEKLNDQHAEIEQQPAKETWQPPDEGRNWAKEREDRKRYFEANFKYGSTTVVRHNGEFFFRGDIRHCGTDNIFFNARKIRSMMEANGQTMGNMNYNDRRPSPPMGLGKRRQTAEADLPGRPVHVCWRRNRGRRPDRRWPIGHIYKDDPLTLKVLRKEPLKRMRRLIPLRGAKHEMRKVRKPNLPRRRDHHPLEIAGEIVKELGSGDLQNRNCLRCTHP